jgi:hypothetical protein
VPERLYRLNHKGKRELQKLLTNSKCPTRQDQGRTIWNRTWISEKTGLDCDPIKKIVKAVDPSVAKPDDFGLPVQESSLIQLFQKLGATQKETDLCKFWSEVETTSDTIAHRPEKLATLLRTLDYTKQQFMFEESLRQSSGTTAFFIPTPCSTTQRWVINRLANSINNAERALRTPLINVKKHPIRANGVDELWAELAKKLKTKQINHEEVLQKLCQMKQKRPVIIALYNFGEDKEDLTPQDVIEEFWLPLIEGLSPSSSRSADSRIVLLIADRNICSHQANSLTLLPSLNSITKGDVEEWLLDRKTVYPWCRNEFGQKWVENFIATKICHWKWNLAEKDLPPEKVLPPGKVLDKLCFGFGLDNGVEDLQRKWEWS